MRTTLIHVYNLVNITFMLFEKLYLLKLYEICQDEMPNKNFMTCCQQCVTDLGREGWDIKNKFLVH